MSDFREKLRTAKDSARETLAKVLSSDPSTTSGRPGAAALSDAGAVDPFETVDASATSSSATPAEGTAPSSSASPSPSSGTPAGSTPPSSSSGTVWAETLSGFVARGCPLAPTDLTSLPPPVHASLARLATGRNESIEAVIQQIAEFFLEEEADQCEGPLIAALEFYVTNFMMEAA